MTQILSHDDSIVARKEHRCWWCGEPIHKGDTYTRWTTVDNGDFQQTRTHPECAAAWGELPFDDPVSFAHFCRGCTCDHGHCECVAADPGEKVGE